MFHGVGRDQVALQIAIGKGDDKGIGITLANFKGEFDEDFTGPADKRPGANADKLDFGWQAFFNGVAQQAILVDSCVLTCCSI